MWQREVRKTLRTRRREEGTIIMRAPWRSKIDPDRRPEEKMKKSWAEPIQAIESAECVDRRRVW